MVHIAPTAITRTSLPAKSVHSLWVHISGPEGNSQLMMPAKMLPDRPNKSGDLTSFVAVGILWTTRGGVD